MIEKDTPTKHILSQHGRLQKEIETAQASKGDTPVVSEMAFVTNRSELSIDNSTIKATLLKSGYAVTSIEDTILVVNQNNDEQFSSKLYAFCKFIGRDYALFDIKVRDSQKLTDIISALHLQTYKDYSRGARQSISAIYEKVILAMKGREDKS